MNRLNNLFKISLVAGSLTVGFSASADQFHYNNFLMGDRAVGLGGAYTAVADDASGVIYNPAGLAFALSNDISGSANAFYAKKITYKNTIGNDPFVEDSSGSLPAFFGILQKLDNVAPGLVAAFGSYTTDSDLKDQDTLIENKKVGGITIRRFHRTTNVRANTQYYSLGAGYRLSSNFAVGFGMSYFSVDELVQEYQDAKQTFTQIEGIEWRILGQNIRQRLSVFGIEPQIGFQWAMGGKFSIGASYKHGIIVGESLEKGVEERTQYLASDDNITSIEAENGSTAAVVTEKVTLKAYDEPMKNWPSKTKLGFAWFASTRFLWTADVTHFSSAKGGNPLFDREAVTNYASGIEYYVLPSFPLRFGMFTNNDARPKLDKAKGGQRDNIDYVGETLFIAWVQPNSQIAVGAILQQGSGEAQKLGNSDIQEVEADSKTFAFSATHNF